MVFGIPFVNHVMRLIIFATAQTVVYLFLVPIILATITYRTYVAVVSKLFRPDLDSFVTGLDTSFLGNTPEESSTNVICCLVVNGNISEYRIREMFEERVIKLKDSKGDFVYKKLSQYWVRFYGYSFWKTDKSFNLSNHVRNYDYDNVITEKPTDEDKLKKAIEDILRTPWKSHQSHWEVLVQYPFNRKSSSETIVPNQTLLIFRVDHALLDALSAMELFRVVFQSPFAIPNPVLNGKIFSVWHKIILWISLPYVLSKALPILLHGRILGKRDPSKGWVYGATKMIPVDMVKGIKKKHSVGFHSVMRSIVNGGICRVLEKQKKLTPDNITTLSTFGTPDHTLGTTNHMKFAVDELPLKSSSSLGRLLATDAALKRFGGGMSSFASLYLCWATSMLPSAICSQFHKAMYYLGPSYILTVMPCTTTREFIDNIEIVDGYCLATLSLPIGMFVTVGGINNKQRINVSATPCILGTNDAPLTDLTTEFLHELEELASLNDC